MKELNPNFLLFGLRQSGLADTRSALLNLIPTTTGSATAITLIYPALAGRLNGHAVRVPLLNASITDCVFEVERPTTVAEINAPGEEPPQLLEGDEFRIVHIDHHAVMIDPRTSLQAHTPLETRTPLQAHTPLEEAVIGRSHRFGVTLRRTLGVLPALREGEIRPLVPVRVMPAQGSVACLCAPPRRFDAEEPP